MVPEIKEKLEEQSAFINQDEKPAAVVPESEVKLEGQSESSEQVKTLSTDQK
uniref:Uncharacterized protein n=1 Tax=Rhizophora mucronata TaxID=61149 RepID=A0A2P2P7G9_RHIMU